MAFNFEKTHTTFQDLLFLDWKPVEVKEDKTVGYIEETLLGTEMKTLPGRCLEIFGAANQKFGYNFRHRHSTDCGEVMTISHKQHRQGRVLHSLASVAFIEAVHHLYQREQDIDLVSRGLACNAWLQHMYKSSKMLATWGHWDLKFEDNGFKCTKQACHMTEVSFLKSARDIINTQAANNGSTSAQAVAISSSKFAQAGFLIIKAQPDDVENVFSHISDQLYDSLEVLTQKDARLVHQSHQLNLFVG